MPINNAARNALSVLKSTNAALSRTSSIIATGKRINSAADAAAYWSIAIRTQTEVDTAGAVLDALALGKAHFTVADAALTAIYDALQEVSDLLVAAQSAGADRAGIQAEIAGLLADITSIASAATTDGVNLLSVDSSAAGYNATVSIVGAFAAGASGITLSTIDLDRSGTALIDPGGGTAAGILDQDRTEGGTTTSVTDIDISALTDSAADLTTIAEMTTIVSAAMDEVVSAQSTVGIALNRMENQITFLEGLNTARETAISALVDADVEEEAARLTALQAQQQLAIEALAIANSQMASVLALFR